VTPKKTGDMIRAALARWKKVVAEAGIKPEQEIEGGRRK